MKLVLRLLILYILFLIQTAIVRPQFDFVLLGLVIFTLHDPSIFSLILGVWVGILLGLINPIYFGFHIIIITLIAFACNNIRRYIYKYKVYFITILFFALLFKYIVSLIFLRSNQSFFVWFLSTVIILTVAIPLESLILKVFYPVPLKEIRNFRD